MIFALYFIVSFLIKGHPQIIDSLFATKIFLLNFTIAIVGARPSIPGIAVIVISDLLIEFLKLKLFKSIVLFFLNFSLTFKKIFESVITK